MIGEERYEASTSAHEQVPSQGGIVGAYVQGALEVLERAEIDQIWTNKVVLEGKTWISRGLWTENNNNN